MAKSPAQAAALLGRKRFRGKYRGTTMEANKRDWNSVVKSSKSQVRQTDQVWFHCQLQASSLAGDLQWHSCPLLVNRWWYKWQVDRLDETLGPGVDTHKSPAPALFQKPVAGVVVVPFFGHKASLARLQQLPVMVMLKVALLLLKGSML